MPVNTGNRVRAPRRLPNGRYNPAHNVAPEGFVNCALCTAAGIGYLLRTQYQNSGQVNNDLLAGVGLAHQWVGQIDTAFTQYWRGQGGYNAVGGMGGGVLELYDQIEGMCHWLRRRVGPIRRFGHANNLRGQDEAIDWMEGKGERAVFAVYIQNFMMPHWLVAAYYQGQLWFIDYQMDVAGSPALRSAVPTCNGEELEEEENRGWVVIYVGRAIRWLPDAEG